jgi:hypothetical protein
VTNIGHTVPSPEFDLAQQIVNDLCQFGLLTVAADARERDLKRVRPARRKDVLLDMGKGFESIDSQHQLEIGRAPACRRGSQHHVACQPMICL